MKENQRRQTYTVPKRDWIHRNPRVFTIGMITISMLVFFSRPIYDIFIADPLPPTARPSRR